MPEKYILGDREIVHAIVDDQWVLTEFGKPDWCVTLLWPEGPHADGETFAFYDNREAPHSGWSRLKATHPEMIAAFEAYIQLTQ